MKRKILKLVKKNKITCLVISLSIILFCSFFFMKGTYGRFSSSGKSNVIGGIAFYVIDLNTSTTEIKLENLAPSNVPYVYDISVSNFNKEKQLETKAEYQIIVRTTTNLNLEYKLYKEGSDENLFISDEIIQDKDGTYYRIMKSDKELFGFTKKVTNDYKFSILFPEQYNDYNYQDILESIEIIVRSSQVID